MNIEHPFTAFKLNKQLMNAVIEAGYQEPTPIQQKAIPLMMAGHDVLGIAPTGTGKTAAYLLPLLMKIKYAQGNYPRALILAPTRELVIQIAENARSLARYTDLRITALYGGTGMMMQKEQVTAGTDLIVSTPARFVDIYRAAEMHTKEIKTFILDEADKMMDMGFFPQIKRILEIIPVKKQKGLFSATFPDKVETLSHEFLEYPERVEVAPQSSTADTVVQLLYPVPNFQTKINLLEKLFENAAEMHRVIIFSKTKTTAQNIYHFLEQKVEVEGEVRVIHGNKSQNTRINAFKDFQSGNIRFLVTTDVCARGIDIREVSHVINFDVPVVYEDYVHRVGRTGRALCTGTAFTFCNPAEKFHIGKIEKIIGMTIPVAPLPEDLEIAPTTFEEKQLIAREIDHQKKLVNPNFKGAFHDKKTLEEKTKFKEKVIAKRIKNKRTGRM